MEKNTIEYAKMDMVYGLTLDDFRYALNPNSHVYIVDAETGEEVTDCDVCDISTLFNKCVVVKAYFAVDYVGVNPPMMIDLLPPDNYIEYEERI